MKKVGSLLLAVLMVLSLAACGKTPAEPTQTPSTQPSTETPTMRSVLIGSEYPTKGTPHFLLSKLG